MAANKSVTVSVNGKPVTLSGERAEAVLSALEGIAAQEIATKGAVTGIHDAARHAVTETAMTHAHANATKSGYGNLLTPTDHAAIDAHVRTGHAGTADALTSGMIGMNETSLSISQPKKHTVSRALEPPKPTFMGDMLDVLSLGTRKKK